MKKENNLPSPGGESEPLKALIFDLLYDQYRGVIVFIRVFRGELKIKQKIKFYRHQKIYQVEKLGVKTPAEESPIPLPGYQKLKPNIYSNLYPNDSLKFNEFKKALLELQLQDSSLTLESIESNILGPGYCCGFLGLLHREIICERIKQEYDLELILTDPTVNYRLILNNGQKIETANPQKMPELNQIKESLSHGFASFDYQFIGFRAGKIMRVDILLNQQLIPDLSFLVHRQFAEARSREICLNLKQTLNRQNFVIPIQACIGNKVIARETLPALQKNVTGNLYGGDRTRKMKLWQKQKKGKKRMQSLGKVSFTEALILEQNLIKKYQPRFNVLLRDDSTYPYLKITAETNPRYLLTKKINPRQKDLCFGPFPDGTKAREILQILEKVFPLAKCKGNLGQPCLDYSLGQCSGHCFKEVEERYYQTTKQKIVDFFQGKTHQVKKKLQAALQKSIARQEFELAKKEKKILDNLNFFVSEQNVEFPDHQNYDFLGFYSQNNQLACFLLLYRYGKLTAHDARIFKIQESLVSEKELLQSYLYQFYQKNLAPKVLYLPQEIGDQELLTEELGFTCQIPRRGKKRKILDIAQQNAQHLWQKNQLDNFQKSDKLQLLEELGKLLQISTPYYIEVLDISNLFQQDIVAGFLTCINGEIDKKKSKIYRLTANGGKGQVKAVLKVFQNLNLKTPVIGLVKNEKHQTEKIVTSKSPSTKMQQLVFPPRGIVKNFLTNLQVEQGADEQDKYQQEKNPSKLIFFPAWESLCL
ncbi:5224_t:CDS:2 [Scutellospora calospora]|uniref:5224_t:CDS:1 n=1 Tax=Scutellospora calospora TaxID=85575 RepID=A0ACA9KJS8_9GLOM|nr:5224_t:CDS:2 [Scutellospora calospora]